jgi:hypothetical protein
MDRKKPKTYYSELIKKGQFLLTRLSPSPSKSTIYQYIKSCGRSIGGAASVLHSQVEEHQIELEPETYLQQIQAG